MFSLWRYSRLKYSRMLWCLNCLLFCSIYFQYSLTSFLSFNRPQLRNCPKCDTCLYETFWSQRPGKSSPAVMSISHGSPCISSLAVMSITHGSPCISSPAVMPISHGSLCIASLAVTSISHGLPCIITDISNDPSDFVFTVIERWELLTNQHVAFSQTISVIHYLQSCSWKYKRRDTYCTMHVAKCTFMTLHSCIENMKKCNRDVLMEGQWFDRASYIGENTVLSLFPLWRHAERRRERSVRTVCWWRPGLLGRGSWSWKHL